MHRILASLQVRSAIRGRTAHRRTHAGTGVALVIAAALLWGTAGLVGAIVHEQSGLSPVSIAFWRLAVGAVATLPLLVRHTAVVRPRREWYRLAGVGFALAMYQACFYAAVNLAGVSLATLIALGLAPVLVAAGSRALFHEKPERLTVGAIGATLVGLPLLVGAPTQQFGSTVIVGAGLASGSALGYASVILAMRQRRGHAPAAAFASATFWVGALTLLPLATWHELGVSTDGLTALLLVYLGVGPTAVAYAAFFAGLATTPAGAAAVLTLVEPITATVLATVVLGEHLTAWSRAGAVVLLGTTAVLGAAQARSG